MEEKIMPPNFWNENWQKYVTRGPLVLYCSPECWVMSKSAVIEEKKFKHSPWAGADNPLGPKFWCQQEGLITMVICCKFKKNLFNLWLYTHLFMIYEGHPISNANIPVTPERMQICLLKSTNLYLSIYVLNICNIIRLRRKSKNVLLFALYNQTQHGREFCWNLQILSGYGEK